ncbi:MAG: diguanylate cyclase [Paracoccaceae bacterium]
MSADPICLAGEAFDVLMPMHLVVNGRGLIERAGPTLAKLLPDIPLKDQIFLDVFELRRPRRVEGVTALAARKCARVQLALRGRGGPVLKGFVTALGDSDRVFLNLSFGISVIDAVRDFRLTAGDFSPTDLTIEMLYLFEAKTAVLEESHKLNQRLQAARIAAEEQAFTDTLTGLKNRRAMDHVLERLIAAQTGFGLMHLDLDFFKDVNDTFGHAAGDHVLQAVAQVLVSETRGEDMIARIGGDEFVLIINRMTDPAQLLRLAARIIARLRAPIPYQGRMCHISGSIGIVSTDFYDTPGAGRMLADADAALYVSKHRGRGRATVFDRADGSHRQLKESHKEHD